MNLCPSAARALVRIARRDAWRHRGRSALAAVLIVLPVAGACVTSVVYRSEQLDPQDKVQLALGRTAQAKISRPESQGQDPSIALVPMVQSPDSGEQSPASVALQDPAAATLIRAILGTLPSGAPRTLGTGVPAVAASLRRLSLPAGDTLARQESWPVWGPTVYFGRAGVDLQGKSVDAAVVAAGLVHLDVGAMPSGPRQVAVSADAARRMGLHVGDLLRVHGPRPGTATGSSGAGKGTTGGHLLFRELRISGTVSGPAVGDWGMLLASRDVAARLAAELSAREPGAVLPNALTGWVLGPVPTDWSSVLETNRLGLIMFSRQVVLHPPAQVVRAERRWAATQYRGSDTSQQLTVIAVGLMGVLIILMATPSLAVGARRNQRMLALVRAAGGTRGHVRALVLAGGGVIGAVSALAGVVLGTGIGVVTVWWLRGHRHAVMPRIDVHGLDLLAIAALGTLTALIAAWQPARQAAAISPVQGLAGTRPSRKLPWRAALTGLFVAGIGVVLARHAEHSRSAVEVVGGISLTELGLAGMSGLVVALAVSLARRLPVSLRLALRDADRHRGRTAPAVAAVMAVIAGGIATATYVDAANHADAFNYSPIAARGDVVVQLGSAGTPIPAVPAAEIAQALRSVLPVTRVLPARALDGTRVELSLDTLGDDASGCTSRPGGCDERRPSPQLLGDLSTLVDDGPVYALYTGGDPGAEAALRRGEVVVPSATMLWPDGTVHLRLQQQAPDATVDTTATTPASAGTASAVSSGDVSPASAPAPRTLVVPGYVATGDLAVDGPVLPTAVAARLGAPVTVSEFIAATSRLPGDGAETRALAALRSLPSLADTVAAAEGGVQVAVERGPARSYGLALVVLAAVATLLTLFGTFATTGLAAVEGRADLATLAAVGAAPSTRRRLAAARAAVVVVLGAAAGIASGLFTGELLIDYWSYSGGVGGALLGGHLLPGWRFAVPWVHVAAFGVGIPLLAVLLAYASTRSRLPLLRRIDR